jgi:hypothetical protein
MPRQRSNATDKVPQQTENTAEKTFRLGQRIKMSPLGAARCPRLAQKTGKISGFANYRNSVVILFDGNTTSTSIHMNYIEPIN